jgi:hypothetical protein
VVPRFSEFSTEKFVCREVEKGGADMGCALSWRKTGSLLVEGWSDTAEWVCRSGNLGEKMSLPFKLLNEANIFPQTDPEAFPYTYRPQDYVQAALAFGCKSIEDMEEMVPAMAKLRDDIVKADEILGETMRIDQDWKTPS